MNENVKKAITEALERAEYTLRDRVARLERATANREEAEADLKRLQGIEAEWEKDCIQFAQKVADLKEELNKNSA